MTTELEGHESQEQEEGGERVEGVDFAEYRQIIAGLNPAFRDTGITDPEGYVAAMHDERTALLRVADGSGLPLFVPIEYVAGYDVERTRRLTGQDNVLVMALPLEVLADRDLQQRIVAGGPPFDAAATAIVVETDHDETEDVKRRLPSIIASRGNYVPYDFLDPRIRNPAEQPASMSIYGSLVAAISQTGERLPRRDIDFHQAFDELEAQGYPLAEYTKLLDPKKLRLDTEQVDELWELCQGRFEWLGEFHPVSMEDTKDFFVQILLSEKTQTVVRYDDEGKPSSIGFFIARLDECEWLSDRFREKIAAEAAAREEQALYFYGIASKTQKEATYHARDIMQLIAAITQQMGGSYRLLFESSNMSSRYIPRMVSGYLGSGEGAKVIEPVRKIAQLDYWYLAAKPD